MSVTQIISVSVSRTVSGLLQTCSPTAYTFCDALRPLGLSVTSRTALYSIRHGECYSNCTVQATVQQARGARDLRDENRRFYDLLWSGARLVEPERFNTWPLVRSLLPESARRLEVAPGLRPRLPLEDTQFVDISAPALAKLRGRSAHVVLGEVTSLPFADDAFDLVCALDIIEHVDDDDGALSELSRVAKQGGTLLISTPLHPSRWTPFDDFVGHKRRYEPQCLVAKLRQHDLAVASSAVFGMQPRSSLLVNIGMWWLTHHRERAMWWYNRALMPLGLWFQKELDLTPGMIATDEVDEILLVCLKSRSGLLAGPKRASEAAPAKQIAG